MAASPPENAPKAATVTPTTPAPKTPQTASTPAAKPSPEKVAAAPKLEGFAVQVGAFKDEERLKQARAKLEAAGLTHYIERIDASGGPITRLRAGQFATREAAEAARAKLQAASLSGQVVTLP